MNQDEIFKIKQRELIIRLTHYRITNIQKVGNISLNDLEQLPDIQILGLPEANIITMALIYSGAVEDGCSHNDAIMLVDSIRPLPMDKKTTEFSNLVDYIYERLKIELAAIESRQPIIRFITKEFITRCCEETKPLVELAKLIRQAN